MSTNIHPETRAGAKKAVLITGVYGSGKSSVAEEMASMLEEQGLPYALLDLDFLAWFDTGGRDGPTEHGMMLTNLAAAVVGNYLAIGVRFFVLAYAVRGVAELDDIRSNLPMPLRVVRLTVPLAEIEARLLSDVTTGRQEDLRRAAEWTAASRGVGIEDLAVPNDRPVRDVAEEVLDHLDWP